MHLRIATATFNEVADSGVRGGGGGISLDPFVVGLFAKHETEVVRTWTVL